MAGVERQVANTGSEILLRAGWVAPMCAGPIRDGAVVFRDATIAAVGSAAALAAAHPAATVINRGDCLVLPGLVNAHVHLELSALAPGAPPSDFVGWLARLIPRGMPDPDATRAFVERSLTIGIDQCLRFGVTCVGDISRQCALTRPRLRDGPIRTVSFGEVQAMARRRGLLDERVDTAIDEACASSMLRIGISPHAPYSIEIAGYARCVGEARARGLPIATHLAETPGEAPFLADHAGPFRALWEDLQAWDAAVPRFAGGPIRMAQSVGLLDRPNALLAHVNECDDDELDLLARGRASVVYCPRTHAYFGRPPHRWRAMLARGINVAVGTDSCASAPDLNLVDDVRLLHRLAGDVPAIQLWQMATTRAAHAIGAEHVGAIAPGKAADFCLFKTTGDDPLTEVLESDCRPTETWVAGRPARG